MTPQEASRKSRELCGLAPVIPVLAIDDLDRKLGGRYLETVDLGRPADLTQLR